MNIYALLNEDDTVVNLAKAAPGITTLGPYQTVDVTEVTPRPKIGDYWNGSAFVDGTVDLEPQRRLALKQIDQMAGETRMLFITSVPGQEATYQFKIEDARAYKAAGYPSDATPYPWINAEAEATGTSAQAAADTIIATGEQWVVVGVMIERTRMTFKTLARNAVDDETLNTAVRSARASFESIADLKPQA